MSKRRVYFINMLLGGWDIQVGMGWAGGGGGC